MTVAILPSETVQYNELTGASTLADVMATADEQVARGDIDHFRAFPTGFSPLDDVLNGGLRPGDLFVLGGPSGVGKTIFSLQMARNVALMQRNANVMYVCYEHDRWHLLMRLLCLESALLGHGEAALTLRRLHQILADAPTKRGLLAELRDHKLYADAVASLDRYASRLTLAKASGTMTTLDQIRTWVLHKLALGVPFFWSLIISKRSRTSHPA